MPVSSPVSMPDGIELTDYLQELLADHVVEEDSVETMHLLLRDLVRIT